MTKKRILVLEDKPTLLHGGQERSLFELIPKLAELFDITLAIKESGELEGAYRRAGIQIKVLPKRVFSFQNPAADAISIVHALWMLLRHRIDLVYVNQYFDLPVLVFAARLLRIPVVCHLRLAAPHYVSRQYRWALDRCTVCIANSKFTRESWLNAGMLPSKIHVIPNGISTEYYVSSDVGIDSKSPYNLVYAGRLSKEKGVDFLIDAFQKLLQTDETNSWQLILTGAERGSDAPAGWVKEKIDSLPDRVQKNIMILPPSSDVRDLINRADVLVFPTLVPESFGRILAEGMAMKTPVVSSRIGAIPEVSSPFSEMLFEPGNTDDLIEKLHKAKDLKRNKDPMLDKMRLNIEQNYGFQHYFESMKILFETV